MSHTFKDSNDREWTLRVTVASARVLREKTGINIYTLPQDKFKGLFELLSDPFQLIEMAHVLSGADVPIADFEAAIDGDALSRLGDAVVEAIPDFFSDIAMRGNLKTVFAKSKKLAERMTAKGTAQIEAFDPETVDLEKLASQIQAQQSSSAASGNGPASPALTPTPRPSPTSP